MSQGSQGRKGRLSVGFALGAAALFGLSAPAGKALLAVTDPWLLAGLLYLGSGLALGAYRAVRDFRSRSTAREALLGRQDWPWLGAAILTGGVIAPVLLMFGLSRVSAAEASLLLNLEGVFTASRRLGGVPRARRWPDCGRHGRHRSGGHGAGLGSRTDCEAQCRRAARGRRLSGLGQRAA